MHIIINYYYYYYLWGTLAKRWKSHDSEGTRVLTWAEQSHWHVTLTLKLLCEEEKETFIIIIIIIIITTIKVMVFWSVFIKFILIDVVRHAPRGLVSDTISNPEGSAYDQFTNPVRVNQFRALPGETSAPKDSPHY